MIRIALDGNRIPHRLAHYLNGLLIVIRIGRTQILDARIEDEGAVGKLLRVDLVIALVFSERLARMRSQSEHERPGEKQGGENAAQRCPPVEAGTRNGARTSIVA